MNYLVSPNPGKREALDFAARLADALEAAGQRAWLLPEAAGGMGEAGQSRAWRGESPDRVIVLGGDGTILRQFHRMTDYRAALWGVNFGHLGYLTDCEPEEALSLLPRILSGDFHVEHRTLIEGDLVRGGRTLARFRGLNEACIYRGALNRAISIEMTLGGVPLRNFVADGLLLCTATGSTAYNHSAGGPLLTPEAEGLVITPICARWSENTPIVTASGDRVEAIIRLPRDLQPGTAPQLVIDGYKSFPLCEGDRVLVRPCSEKLQMIRTHTGSFCERLSRKLSALSLD